MLLYHGWTRDSVLSVYRKFTFASYFCNDQVCSLLIIDSVSTCSSQVGCRQACTFCATGRMGKLRSLTADEILVQVYYASKICRVVGNILNDDGSSSANVLLPKVDNIGKKELFSSCICVTFWSLIFL